MITDSDGEAVRQGVALSIESLQYSIGSRQLFRDLSLSVGYRESVAIIGRSGSGKSTLLSCILALIRPDDGVVNVAGRNITKLRGRTLAEHRRKNVGMVFQFGELLSELTPLDNVALAALLDRTGRRTAYDRSQALLEQMNVRPDGLTDRLSGGERQRVAVARALINKPGLVLADEPTGSLDGKSRNQVADLLFRLPAEQGCGLLVVTHDTSIADRADRTLELQHGVLRPVARTVGRAR